MSRPSSPSIDWWRGGVIYQIYPRSFADANGDGVGDLAGITQRLDHVASLGVDAIWISPIFKSPMKDFGYDVADYRAIDPLFGTLAEFDALLARAHVLGLKVIIDQVLSHTSDQHAWFAASRASRDNPQADWYVWADPQPDGSPPNNWLSVFGGSAWQWDGVRRQYYLHSFLASQPDLNFHHPQVRAALLADVTFWCQRGVDGFRFDACNHQFHDARLRSNPPASQAEQHGATTVRPDNPYAMQRHLYDKSQPENLAFLADLRRVLDAHGAASVGEVGDEHPAPLMAAYTAAGQRLHMAYSFALLSGTVSAAHIRREVQQLDSALATTGGWGCWALSNHDVPRVVSRWGGKPETWLALLLTLRGSACLYQGEELGLPEAELTLEQLRDPYGIAFWPAFKGRDGCRTPMPWQAQAPHAGFSTATPWLPVPPEHAARAVDTAPASLAFTRALLAWRRAEPALRTGAITFLDTPEPVLAYTRTDAQGRGWLLAFNLSAAPAAFTPPPGARAAPEGPLAACEDGLLPPWGVAAWRG